MQIISDKEEMIFKQEKDNKRYYSIGLSRKDKKTYPHVFINDFEVVEQEEKNPFEQFGDSIKTESQIGQQIKIEDEDLPF